MELETVLPAARRPGLHPVRVAFASDERLARLVAGGDEAAFRVVYERYHQPLHAYCRSLVHHEADAQDALQSAFASALTALRRGNRNAPLRPWLYRIAHNESVSLLRRRGPVVAITDLPVPTTTSLEEEVEERERFARLMSDLRELPDRQRGALVMRELSGLTHQEIALALDTSVNATKQTIFEARKSLTEFAEGRAMACDEVCRLISDADGRVLRSRRVRAHLRECRGCAAFAAAIPERSAQFRAIATPLPAVAAGGILARALGGGSIHGGDGTGLLAAGASKAVGAAIAVKAATVAVVLTAAVGATVALTQPKVTAHSVAGGRAAGTAPGLGTGAERNGAVGASRGTGISIKAARVGPLSRVQSFGEPARTRHGQRSAGHSSAGRAGAGAASASPSLHARGRSAARSHAGGNRKSSTGSPASSTSRSHGARGASKKNSAAGSARHHGSGTSHQPKPATTVHGNGTVHVSGGTNPAPNHIPRTPRVQTNARNT